MLYLWIIASLSIVFYSFYNGITPTPTSKKVRKALIAALPINIENKPVIDIGSGFGTLLTPLSKKYPHNKIIGYENSWVPYLFSKILTLTNKNITIYRKNFYKENLGNSSLIVCYLFPKAMLKLRDKFTNELQNNTWVASHTFSIPELTPGIRTSALDIYKTPIYIYRF